MNIDETSDDIILPDTYWGELQYIIACLKDILHNKSERKILFIRLIRQIKIHHKWMKVK